MSEWILFVPDQNGSWAWNFEQCQFTSASTEWLATHYPTHTPLWICSEGITVASAEAARLRAIWHGEFRVLIKSQLPKKRPNISWWLTLTVKASWFVTLTKISFCSFCFVTNYSANWYNVLMRRSSIQTSFQVVRRRVSTVKKLKSAHVDESTEATLQHVDVRVMVTADFTDGEIKREMLNNEHGRPSGNTRKQTMKWF